MSNSSGPLARTRSSDPDNNTDNTGLPFDSVVESEELGYLSYRQLIWKRLRKNQMGITAAIILLSSYMIALGANFFAPYHYNQIQMRYRHVPPQKLRFSLRRGLHVYGLKSVRTPETRELVFTPDEIKIFPVRFLYRDNQNGLHLLSSDGPMFLLGTDRMGRDLLSRIMHGARVSMTVGLVGVFISLIFGSILGTISGYLGGWTDTLIQRAIEILLAFPSIPLWMALGAALPAEWSSVAVYFGITVILALVSWGGLARQVRGKVMAYRELDFVKAAQAAGASHWHIITRHLMPGSYSHIIVIATLAIPGMILGETALSFLGLGIRPPMTSWGVLLEEAQRVTVLLHYPWLILPAIPVLVVVISFNFLGDALRDATDPYAD